jgi:CRISPR-associated protein Csb2
MGERALWIEVRWPDGRFHGVREGRDHGRGADTVVPEWPPSPFRLFQSLVAGAYGGRWVNEGREEKDAAFVWLEGLDPPAVSAPPRKALRPVTYFVPNNDLDAKGGDPSQVASVRTSKTLRTSLFDADRPAAFVWTFEGDDAPAQRMAELAARLHTLGHGIDAAFAHAEVLDAPDAEARLLALGGAPHRPSLSVAAGNGGVPCPTRGSLDSLRRRHHAFTERFERVGAGRKAITEFRQPLKSHARAIAYDRTAARLLFELTPIDGGRRFRSWPLGEAATLVVAVRNLLGRELTAAWPAEVARLVIGQGAGPDDAAVRLRIVPLPSIGMRYTDPDIRRVLIEVPPDHPIPLNDLEWALAGRELADDHGELTGVVLAPTTDTTMLRLYGIETGSSQPASLVWRTVTPAALPETRGRGGQARAEGEARVAGSVASALRHAGVAMQVMGVRVQREPFDLKGKRSDAFQPDRFDARNLRHVELTFARPVSGPIIIGDGRWLGLGLMRPLPDSLVERREGTDGLHVFTIETGPALRWSDAETITRALRRAVMARAEGIAGPRLKRGDNLPVFFTGHSETGAPGRATAKAQSGFHEHLFFGLDLSGGAPRLLIIAPHRADRNPEVRQRTRNQLEWLAEAIDGLDDLRVGALGRFGVRQSGLGVRDRVFGFGAVWSSLTPYVPTRHPKHGQDASEVLQKDVARELERRNLPRPSIEVLTMHMGQRGGLRATLRLRFALAIAGPILVGRNSHFGAGLFGASEPDAVST